MSKYIFDADRLLFFPKALKNYYGDDFPVTGTEITEDEFASFRIPPDGKMLGAFNGRPAWMDLPLDDVDVPAIQA
ncbi:hypothetical protein [Lelliottia sp. RWM.1]|uniref:hypothetical protein n=1 Tax=Lelliottia sp. RWM.1 TaxID=2663242 RepID=UPI00193DA753|nr:hypothetical protein [Lelliottia sp. RWM.1]MBM3073625.1 hypothetical protein [Lelliottia sp. RWM.1]